MNKFNLNNKEIISLAFSFLFVSLQIWENFFSYFLFVNCERGKHLNHLFARIRILNDESLFKEETLVKNNVT